MKKIFFTICTALIIFSSCAKNNKDENLKNEEIALQEQVPLWENSAEKICIVFGYGYNNENFTKSEIEHLEKNFGLSDGTENSGMILPFVYPDDFKIGNTGRISHLLKLVEDVKLKGLITIGAPEYANNMLASLREKMQVENEFPIYTFFPQDEILAIEATSDFVLDKAVEQSVDNIEEMKNENDQVAVIGIEKIIDNAVRFISTKDKNPASNFETQNIVSQIVGNEYQIKRYVDPETGLSSINHFIIEEKEVAEQK